MSSYIKAFFISIHCIIIAILTILVSPIDKKGKITHYLSKIFGGVILFIAGVKVKVEGREKLNPDDNYIFISNHLSYFDIPILMIAIPNNVRFIYKDTMTKIPILGWGMYLGQYIPINRENVREAMKSLKKAAEKVVSGISVVIFPEGTRSMDGTLGEFKRGTFVLADEAKVPLVPTTVIGSNVIMPRGKFQIRSGNVKVVFSKPVQYRKDKLLLEEIREKINDSLNG
ncbi:MAG TPA: lysophospholipid acyltransferase family protein [Ignavibacteria bacterium]|nr:lysophospholipid acyltransferase family protein [Ignavibacteria bacterium]HMR39156.1 lysophospholipid acyltransferase family protein [Ignavibacteria bacterium]